ncbi:MAG: response regulator [Phycisphaerae bacterium]|nr:response regulator [Phycisphaerae bacterium]
MVCVRASASANACGVEYNNTPVAAAGLTLAALVLAIAGLTAAVLAALMTCRRMTKKKTRHETFSSLSQIHEEIQTLSEERDAALAALQEQGNLLQAITGAVAQGVFWKNADGAYRGCNEKYACWSGRRRSDEVIGKTDHELLADKAKAELHANCDKEVMKTGIGLLDMTETVQTAAGTRVDLLVSKLPLRDVKGRTIGIVGICTDVTDLQQSGGAKDVARDALLHTMDSMQEGVVMIDAHGRIAEANDYYAALVHKPAEALQGQHICDIMTHPADQQLRKILDQFGRSLPNAAAEAFSHCLGQKDFYIRVHPVHCGQRYDGAVLNFIDVSEFTQAKERAEYASYRKGRFLASMSHQIRTPLNDVIGFAELLGQESLTSDQGRFVDMIVSSANRIREVVEEIADLCREHVEELAEDDRVRHSTRCEPGRSDDHKDGECSADASAAEAPALAGEEEEYAILVVDDVPENRMLLEVLLTRKGYKTIMSSSGSEAVEASDRRRFDLILMDIQMPGMDGLEATRTIRSRPVNADTPILAMTASLAREDELRCLEAGCDDYIRKPIRKESLLRKVWRFIEQQKQVRAADRGDEIVSFLSDSPDYHKTIETFVANLPGRIQEMQHALEAENLQDLAFKAHTLRGLGGFAGFPIYTELAKAIEQGIHDSRMDDIRQKLDEMVALCRRTRLVDDKTESQ